MTQRLFDLIDRLNRAQKGVGFRIVATVLGLASVGTALGLTLGRHGQFLPAPYVENIYSSTLIAAVIVIAVVWLNQTLTAVFYEGLAIPLSIVLRWQGQMMWSEAALGIGTMAVVFLTLLQAARVLLDLGWRPLAVARLVLDEAVRMKLALVFIVGLVILIPLLATRMDPEEPLRYRIQTFLSYGTGLSYAMLAVMTLFVSTATVAFEQRDKQILQVITKPITRSQYLIGKWIGVMALNLILLSMVGGSVFWFTQYLRQLPALDPYDELAVAEQVLTARVGVPPTLIDHTKESERRARAEIEMTPGLDMNAATLLSVGQRYFNEFRGRELSVDPAQHKVFRFTGLKPISRTKRVFAQPGQEIELSTAIKHPLDVRVVSDDGKIVYAYGTHYLIVANSDPARLFIRPVGEQAHPNIKIQPDQPLRIRYFPANAMTLRFKINSGNNDPGVQFDISFGIPGIPMPLVRRVVLVQTQTMLIPAGAVTDDGELYITVINGAVVRHPQTGELVLIEGPDTIKFPPDGLEVMYKVSSFETNYLRAMLINWIKLGFLAMLGISAATFSSFPVACLLAFAIFLGAETAPYMTEALEYYEVKDKVSGNTYYYRWVIWWISTAMNWMLQSFGSIRPTQNLIEGRVVPWTAVLQTFAVIAGLWTTLSYGVGWIAFRSRQLAIYSGHQ